MQCYERENRKSLQLSDLKEQNEQLEDDRDYYEKDNIELLSQLNTQLNDKLKEQRSKNYYKNKVFS